MSGEARTVLCLLGSKTLTPIIMNIRPFATAVFCHALLFSTTITASLRAASDVTVSTGATAGGAFSGGSPNVYTPTASPAVANTGTIQTSLNSGNAVTITTASGAAGNGDLTMTSQVAKTGGASSLLTLNAVRDLALNAALTASGGPLPVTLVAGRNLTVGNAVTTNGGNLTISPVGTATVSNGLNAGIGQLLFTSGILATAGSNTLTANTVQTALGSELQGPLAISGNFVSGGTLNLSGTSAATLTVSQTATLQAASTTIVDLATNTSADRITATGAVAVAGTLQLRLSAALETTITPTASWTIVSGSAVTGTFAGLPSGSRITFPNELGSVRITYNATTVVLDDWQPYIRELTWDSGTAEIGTQILTNTNTRNGRHYFHVTAQSTDVGAWRTRLNVISGEATLYLRLGAYPDTGSYTHRSMNAGSDGLMLRDDQFAGGQEWFLMVDATAGAQWSVVSGRAYVHDLGELSYTDSNANSQYDIGEAVQPSTAPAFAMGPEGIRFYRAVTPIGTPGWSLWLLGSTRDVALRGAKVPFQSSSAYYTRKQAGQMLVVAPVLGTGSNAYFLSVVAPAGEAIGLDSRIQTVTDIPFSATVPNVAVTGAPYRVYRTQVPVDQIAWDVSTTANAGNPNVCVRKIDAPAEYDNDAFSEATGTATDSITLVPDFLTNGTWLITVWGTAPYNFTLTSGDPVVTPINFTDLKTNDQPGRAGWRFYSLTDIPAQVGNLGWELLLANHVPGTQIAIRRNKVPSRWQYRANGGVIVNDTASQYMDYAGSGGFLQRPGHQADVWYVGVFLAQQPLGAFDIDVHPIIPGTAAFNGSSTAVAGLQPGRWKFQRIDVPAGVVGWDLRVKDATGGTPILVVRRDQLPATASTSGWSPSSSPSWPSGDAWRGVTDWSGRTYDIGSPTNLAVPPRLVMGMGRPLEAGTYYVGVFNNHASGNLDYTIESRGIGTGMTLPVTNLAYAAGSSATITNLSPREAAYYKVTVPANTPSWEITLAPSVGEMMLAMRRGTVPDFTTVDSGASLDGNVQYDAGTNGERQVEMQKAGPERYALLPLNNQDYLTAGDYYLAVISEGANPPASNTIGTGTSSGVLTSNGPLVTTNLGAASVAGITQPVSLAGGQVRSYAFTVPAGTASLELRLDNRVGNPVMSLIGGTRAPQPGDTTNGYNYYGYIGGQYSVTAGVTARTSHDALITIANPPAGPYSLTLRAESVSNAWPDATANLVVVANAPVPLAFDGGTANMAGQVPDAWRYFSFTVPPGAVGWDVRLKNVTSGTPILVVRRDQLPATTATTSGWTPSAAPDWPSGNAWRGGTDWTGRTYDIGSPTNLAVPPRLVMGTGRPLEAGTYYVGVFNNHASANLEYTIESRGIGTGMTLPVINLGYAAGSSAAITNLAPREAAYYKVTIPANTPSWEVTLAPSAGEMMLAMRRGTVPDFATVDSGASVDGNVQYDAGTNGERQVEMQKAGQERYVLLPLNNQDYLTAGDYYLAVISEGVSPPASNTIGTGTSSGVLTSNGPLVTMNLGAASIAGITQPVNLAGGQVQAYSFTVPAGTASLELRLDNRVGNPVMSLIGGTRAPQPGETTNGYNYYGYIGGQYSVTAGVTARTTHDSLITIANPPTGSYSLTLRAESVSNAWPDATANLVVVANAPVPLAFDGGTANMAGQVPDAWRYFSFIVPPGAVGWDVRLKNVTSGTPILVVRRDQLPATTSTTGGWTPSSSPNWPSGNAWRGGTDWSGRTYDIGSPTNQAVPPRQVMGMGRPLEAGTYYVGVYNSHASENLSYSIESRGIGTGLTLPVTNLGYAAGSSATITNLARREAAYYKVTIPASTPSWELTLAPSAGEMMLAMRRGTVPDFTTADSGASYDGNVQYDAGANGERQVEMQKAGPERYVLLPLNDQDFLTAGDYYLAVISEGTNPPAANTIGTGTSSGTLTSNGPLVTTNLGAASIAGTTLPVNLEGGQVKTYTFTVPPGTQALEARLDNRVGNPVMSLISGSRSPQPGITTNGYNQYGYIGGQYSVPTGGVARVNHASIITVANPIAGTYSLTVRSETVGSLYPNSTADLTIRQKPRIPLNFSADLNGNGYSHTDTRQLIDAEKTFYEVAVPTLVKGQPVIGWLLKVNLLQGDTTMRIYKTWGSPSSGITVNNNTALIVPPFFTPGDTWFVEVQADGLTHYTITSQPVTLERPAWPMPAGHNTPFGDSGTDGSGNPLPGDRGIDIGQDDWHFYAVDVPAGNAGLLRTELQAINGNPNLYIREDGVPTTDHNANGNSGADLVNRSLTSTASEYGNWVPWDGRYQNQLRAGRWYLGVRATGGTNARYRLLVSTGQVTDLAVNGATVANQILVGRDWRYYRFAVPLDAPNTWNLTFSQQVGDVVMFLRDSVAPGNGATGLESTDSGVGYTYNLRTWYGDGKNQGPYSNVGHDAAGTYPFNTPPLRPGHTYYVGFKANSDATFSFSTAVTGGTIGSLPLLDFYTGTLNLSIPASSSLVYRIPVPAEATRMKWTATHPTTVQLRLEQGTLPGTTGTQHWISGTGANVAFNQALSLTSWPWQPNQNYYLRAVNTSASPQTLVLTMAGKNAGTEDEDGDGLPDAWELTYFPSIGSYNGAGDPDNDGVTNAVEFTDGTIPNVTASAKYFLNVTAAHGTVGTAPTLVKYDRGSIVSLTHTAEAGYGFLGWQLLGNYGDQFALRATGTLSIPVAGTYTFGVNSDEGCRLTINGTAVITDDATHSPADRFGQVALAAGTYPLELLYFERTSGEEVELFAAAGSHAAYNSNFRLLGDTAGGGLLVQTLSGGGLVPGFAVQQVLAVNADIYTLARATDLLGGVVHPQRASATLIAPTVNFLGSGSADGHFAANANFPLQQPLAASPGDLTMLGDYAVAALASIPLAVALDNAALTWSTADTLPWLGEKSALAFDATDDAVSGPITHGQASTLTTQVVGPGTLTFRWKVSSETSGDYLQLYFNTTLKQQISGNQAWALVTYPVPAGLQTLRWRYTKNGSVNGGSDAAWVDQIQWVPTGGYAAWIAGYPALAGAAALPGADPDSDGHLNIAEYGLGGVPNQGARLNNPVVTTDVLGRVVLTVTKPAGYDVSDLTYTVEGSSNLVNWNTTNLTIVTSNVTTLVVRDDTPGAPQRFLRLKLSLP